MTVLAPIGETSAYRIRPKGPIRQTLTRDISGSWSNDELTGSVFGAGRLPRWLVPARDRISELVQLPWGWDGHDGCPVKIDIAKFAIRILLQVLESDSPAPQIVPLSGGGAQLEWHQNGIDLEIEIDAPNQVFVSFEDLESGIGFERSFSTDYGDLVPIIRRLGRMSKAAT